MVRGEIERRCKTMAKNSIWDKILKVIIAVASAVLGAIGGSAMNL